MKSRDFCYWLQGFFEIADLDEEFRSEKHPDKTGVMRAHLMHSDKILICDSIGLDRWGDPQKEGIVNLCEEFLSELR